MRMTIGALLLLMASSCGGGGGSSSATVPQHDEIEGLFTGMVFDWAVSPQAEALAGGSFLACGQYHVFPSFAAGASLNRHLTGQATASVSYAAAPTIGCDFTVLPGTYASHATGNLATGQIVLTDNNGDEIRFAITGGTEVLQAGTCANGAEDTNMTLQVVAGTGRWAGASGVGTFFVRYNTQTLESAGRLNASVDF